MQIRIVYGAATFPGGDTPEAKKAAREKYAAGPLLNSLKLFELRLKKTPGPFLLDKQMTLADLWAFFVYGGVVIGGVSGDKRRDH